MSPASTASSCGSFAAGSEEPHAGQLNFPQHWLLFARALVMHPGLEKSSCFTETHRGTVFPSGCQSYFPFPLFPGQSQSKEPDLETAKASIRESGYTGLVSFLLALPHPCFNLNTQVKACSPCHRGWTGSRRACPEVAGI